MSCNGCRVLRKGCSESCILRPCLQWIDTPEAQGHATVFVAKFFGRADLMSFISNVPQPQRPALFQSLLLEACGRTVNPVNGAVGLLWTGNWHVCQAAVETVLRGGTPRPIPEFLGLDALTSTADDASEGEVTCNDARKVQDPNQNSRFVSSRSNKNALTSSCRREIRRPGTPSMNSEESVTTMTSLESGIGDQYVNDGDRKVLNLFV
uniref:LOB domain-containing protein 38 isoform X2 n=1 Tax=Cicer arietinum TaxID=3827 RepID=A0A3Q7XXC2_CICAR|nr:LOB domain-containing protein 38 isoform X2 [Cicer arietinum]